MTLTPTTLPLTAHWAGLYPTHSLFSSSLRGTARQSSRTGFPIAKNRGRIVHMTFYEVLEQVMALLQRHGRASYCTLIWQYALDNTSLKEHM
jgi:hypothetical protein